MPFYKEKINKFHNIYCKLWMKKNELNLIHNLWELLWFHFITVPVPLRFVIKLPSQLWVRFGKKLRQKVTVCTVPVPQHWYKAVRSCQASCWMFQLWLELGEAWLPKRWLNSGLASLTVSLISGIIWLPRDCPFTWRDGGSQALTGISLASYWPYLKERQISGLGWYIPVSQVNVSLPAEMVDLWIWVYIPVF